MPTNKEIIGGGGIVLTVLLAIFFWFATWGVIGSSTHWAIGVFAAIVSFVVYGVVAVLVIRGIVKWADLDW